MVCDCARSPAGAIRTADATTAVRIARFMPVTPICLHVVGAATPLPRARAHEAPLGHQFIGAVCLPSVELWRRWRQSRDSRTASRRAWAAARAMGREPPDIPDDLRHAGAEGDGRRAPIGRRTANEAAYSVEPPISRSVFQAGHPRGWNATC
jgi:hypothetical protein